MMRAPNPLRLHKGAFTQPVRQPGTPVPMSPMAHQSMLNFYAKLGVKPPNGMIPQGGQVMPGLIKP